MKSCEFFTKTCFKVTLFFGLQMASVYTVSPTLEEKVGQMLMVHFNGEVPNEDSRRLIEELYVGGIIYYNFSNNLSVPKQVFQLSQGLQKSAKNTPQRIPLFIAVDQEGGRVNRLTQGFTLFPGNGALGHTKNVALAEQCAYVMGKELKGVGVNLNLAPDVDINLEPRNPIIGIRSFGSDAKLVSCFGKAMLKGYQQAGIIPTLKHFPGHGDVCMDSHESLPIVKKSKEDLYRYELAPFASLSKEADIIMSAHLLVPVLDPIHPATFSRKIINDILRQELGFQGLIMTDSLAMQGIIKVCSHLEESVFRSIDAGHDIILLGGKQLLTSQNGFEITVDQVAKIHAFIVKAVRERKISEERINASFQRIVALKKKYGLFETTSTDFSPDILRAEESEKLAQEIANKALCIIKKSSVITENVKVFAPSLLQDALEQTHWKNKNIFYFNESQLSGEEQEKLCKEQAVILFTSNGWQSTFQQNLFNQLQRLTSHITVIAIRDPIDADFFASAETIISTRSPVSYSLQAAFEVVFSEDDALHAYGDLHHDAIRHDDANHHPSDDVSPNNLPNTHANEDGLHKL